VELVPGPDRRADPGTAHAPHAGWPCAVL